MHVLILPSWYPTREAPLNGIYFAEQAQCLADHGMRVGVVYPEQQSLRRLSWDGLRTKHFQTEWTDEHGVPTLRRYGWNIWSRFPPGLRVRVRSAVRLARIYIDRYGPPDLVHVQSGHWAGAAAARLREQYDLPVVITEHFSGFQRDSIFPWRWPLVQEGYQHADLVSSVSTRLAEALDEHGLAPSNEVVLHPNLAPTASFSRPCSPRSAPPPFRVVTIARLVSRKNVGGLIEALAENIFPYPTTLRIVGDGPERSRLEAQVQTHGLQNQVQFLGQQPRSSVPSILQDAHALVLPSRHETFGVVLLEAMATGLPVVATACGGPADIVTNETGLLVPTDDPDSLAEAIGTLQRRGDAYNPEAIRISVRNRYGPETFVRRTRTLYQRALELHA